MSRGTDLAKLRTKGGTPAELNDINRLDEAIYQRQLEVSRLMDRRRAIIARVQSRHHQRIRRAQ